MSTQCGKLVSLILYEHFGEIVEKVGYHLFKYGVSPLWPIVKYTELPVSQVKLALCILIKYGLISFESTKSDAFSEYKLLPDNVLLILRYPKFISHIKKLFGEEAEILIEESLIRGYVTASDLILNTVKRMKKNNKECTLPQIRDKLLSLVTARYICRYSCGENKIQESEQFRLPSLNLATLTTSPEDNEIYWCVNFDRFHQDMRDMLITSAVTRRFDENAGELMKALLQQMYARTEPWAESSNPISVTEVREALRKMGVDNTNSARPLAYLDHYLTVLAEDESEFVAKAGDAAGGQYIIRLKHAVEQLAWAALELLVLERFDTKAARIFRLVRRKRYIEPDNIQQLAMIPTKEAKRLSYQLLEEDFLRIHELRKSAAGATGPAKCFVLFHIDLDAAVRRAVELCHKAMYNAMTRRHHDKHINRRIIDKKHRVDTIALSLKEQGAPEEQLADIEDMITPPEKEMLERIGKVMKKLNTAELEIDDTLHLLQLYLQYFCSPVPTVIT